MDRTTPLVGDEHEDNTNLKWFGLPPACYLDCPDRSENPWDSLDERAGDSSEADHASLRCQEGTNIWAHPKHKQLWYLCDSTLRFGADALESDKARLNAIAVTNALKAACPQFKSITAKVMGGCKVKQLNE